jgi:hypothetical protein
MSLVMETWLLASDDQYEVSNHGRIRSLRSGQVLKPWPVTKGYLAVEFWRDNKKSRVFIHRQVAQIFLGPAEGQEVRHLNGNPQDNRLENLAYGTRQQNALDMVRHGTQWQQKKTHCPRGHLLAEPNLGREKHRTCLSCRQAKRYVKRHPELLLQEEADRRYALIMG